MGLIDSIDHSVKTLTFAMFRFFIDPMSKDRLFGQLKDMMERNLDVSSPNQIVAPDNFEIQVNNHVFIKHAHAIAKLEKVLADSLRKYAVDMDYEINAQRVSLQIVASSTISKRKADIRTWFSSDGNAPAMQSQAEYTLAVVDGEGKGSSWTIVPGRAYKIGRVSTSDICLPYDNMSKHHATLYFTSEKDIAVEDEGSANGTFIGAERIQSRTAVAIGSEIRFCHQDPITLKLSK